MIRLGFLVLFVGIGTAYAEVSRDAMRKIERLNEEGPYFGIVVPNAFEMNPLLQSQNFVAHAQVPYLDFSGRRFRIGKVENVKVIIVMTGLSMRYGDGPDDQLPLESNGDYTRKIGFLDFSDYNNKTDTKLGKQSVDNLLNNVWYQPEEIFPVNGVPEVRQHAFWVPVDKHYFKIAKKVQGLKLEGCVNSTCLPRTPVVVRVKKGVSANVFVDNSAYREFLNSKFNATPIDMESAAVALICQQQRTPFIAIRALSDLAGGGSAVSNEAGIFASLAAQNSVAALLRFIALLFA
ncbi:conserved hypothetical protein [Ricinus communis]|uniref:Nucleoside phosphorylase domain-containing protein n=1 Tax=Ricinus communis TaxID=3988 RepID=B9RKM6_RICCO|nr:conserved hypothetical protein [Ricinus communis]